MPERTESVPLNASNIGRSETARYSSTKAEQNSGLSNLLYFLCLYKNIFTTAFFQPFSNFILMVITSFMMFPDYTHYFRFFYFRHVLTLHSVTDLN